MKNIFESIPQNLEQEVFEAIIQHENVKIERSISKGQASPGTDWYNEKYNEWVMVLKGEAIITFEQGEPMRMKVGDYLNIPAHQKYRVDWTDPNTETIWLAVMY
jgi:cupin 2 domain-containing protein